MMRNMLICLVAVSAMAVSVRGQPAWESVTFEFAEGMANRVRGPGQTFTAIPWAKLGLHTPPQGTWMGFNILVNDDDGGGRRGWVNWAPGIGEWKDPSLFPKVLW